MRLREWLFVAVGCWNWPFWRLGAGDRPVVFARVGASVSTAESLLALSSRLYRIVSRLSGYERRRVSVVGEVFDAVEDLHDQPGCGCSVRDAGLRVRPWRTSLAAVKSRQHEAFRV